MASKTRGSKKGSSDDRETNLDDDFIVTTRVRKGLKRWKFLQTEILRKKRKVDKGSRSKYLEPYKKERDGLVEQMQKDIPVLQSIFFDEYSRAFERADKRRTTTGGMKNEHGDSLRSAESKINELTSQLLAERKSKEEALSSLRSAESKTNELTSQLETERKSKEEALSRLARDNELTNKLETERKASEDALVKLQRGLAESENEKVALKISYKEEIGVHEEERRKLQESLRSVESEIDQLKRQLDNEKKSREESVSSLQSAESWINQLKRQIENERKSREEALSRLEARINQLTTQVENERKAKEDALLRLSSMASSKLRDNNPNIADLSDPNRPTKLSEQFSELYDNEWTDAFDELEKLLGDKEDKYKKEMEIISYLRDFMVEIHSVCNDLSFSKLKTIEEAFVKPSVPSEDTKIPTEILKTIKDGIKTMAPKLLEKTRELVLDRLKEKYKDDPVEGCLQHHNVKRYIDKCTDVCWYMSVQDPQLVIDGSKSPDDKFDSIKHREYTKKGPYEDFVVWPALYLHKGGPMLSKGVAQGKKEMTGQQ
ncbi:hypothetical protein ACJMK2_030801 [Sinanodonta woodiana]|uniref:Mitochondria-eating protein n=1 Tax=Sinanodonta woodiana TaxID=1069815 RepID=A0ABD3WWW5_SINWO